MNAFEARKASVQPQYEAVMKDIEEEVNLGRKSTNVCPLYHEVAERIAKEGYDVKIVIRANKLMSYNEISWENGKEGKEGKLTYVDETKTNISIPFFPFGDILTDIYEHGFAGEESQQSEEDEEDTKANNREETSEDSGITD